MPTRVKICGINSEAAMDAAVEHGADWIGFVFAKSSPRHVTYDRAEALSLRHSGGPLRVGLFVNPTETQIEDALDAVPLDALQLYADAERAAELRDIFGLTVWRAIGIAAAEDLPGPEPLDGFVLDARPKPGATRPGGNAEAFDWSIPRLWSPTLPWLLAGGLTPENVGTAIAASGAAAVDVSSGVESAPGLKDPARIAAFIRAARFLDPGL